jgi:glycerophosphoryl diester phosphodiesterase
MSPLAAISAHRGGGEDAGAGTYEAYANALEAGAEYVEFDIRRTADGELAVYHDAHAGPHAGEHAALGQISYTRLCALAGYEVPRVTEIMRLIAGSASGHLDLKETGGEHTIIEQALAILGPGNFVVTTLEDASVAAIKARFPDVPVGLSLGRDLAGVPRLFRPSARRHEVFPMGRIRACGADWVAMHHGLALAGALRRCRHHHIKTMVWTVNSDPGISRWLADFRVDVLVTDRPRRAIATRDRLRGGAQPIVGEMAK